MAENAQVKSTFLFDKSIRYLILIPVKTVALQNIKFSKGIRRYYTNRRPRLSRQQRATFFLCGIFKFQNIEIGRSDNTTSINMFHAFSFISCWYFYDEAETYQKQNNQSVFEWWDSSTYVVFPGSITLEEDCIERMWRCIPGYWTRKSLR